MATKVQAQDVVKRYERAKGERINWDEYWEDLAEFFIPNKDNVYGYKLTGERKFNRLFDSTSVHAVEMLSSSLHGMMTNSASVWFGLTTGRQDLDQDKEVAQYLQTCVRIITDTLNSSNFQEEIHETYLDLVGIGTTVLSMEEDDDAALRFKSSPIYETYIGENEKGEVDKLWKVRKYTLEQIRDEFGDDLLKEHVDLQLDFQSDRCRDKKYEVIFEILPERDDEGSKTGKWLGRWVLRKPEFVLKESTYHSWPFAVPRWTKLNSEVYGRSPSMKCLPDVKMLNSVMKATIRGLQKTVDPPLMVPDNGFLLPIKTSPGSTNFYRTGMKDRIEPFPNAARPDIGEDFMESIRQRIRETFFIDQLQLINQRDMTATEVMQRTDERLRFLGPILGRLNNELLKPIIDRVFEVLDRQGKLPDPPQKLEGLAELKINYTSQIAKAQKTGEANVLMKVLQAAGPIVQSQPDVMDNFDGDGTIQYLSTLFGLPHEMLRDMKVVKEVRQQRAQAQQQAAQAQQENVEADTAQKQAKAQQ